MPPTVAWKRASGDTFSPPSNSSLRYFDGQGETPLSVTLPQSPSSEDWGHYTLWYIAPRTCSGNGWALLGEVEKIIPMAQQRVTAMDADCTEGKEQLTVSIVGQPSEIVTLTFVSPRHEVVDKQVTVGADGTAKVQV